MTFPSALAAGTLVTLADESGTPLVSFETSKTIQNIVIASPKLESGRTYSFYTGGTSGTAAKDGLYEGGSLSGGMEVVSFELGDSAVTYVDESGVTTGGGGMGGGRGGFGGQGGGRGQGGMTPPDGQGFAPPDGAPGEPPAQGDGPGSTTPGDSSAPGAAGSASGAAGAESGA